MPFVTLSDGQTEVRVGVKHTNNETLPDVPGVEFRGTTIRLTMPNGSDLYARSVCKPPDPFQRFEGRRLAARRLMTEIGKQLSKDDKSLIFRTICPECP